MTSGNEEQPGNPSKKAYEKPKLTEVSLRPEEAVLGNCKTASVSGPAQSDCTLFTGCASVGS